MSTKFVTDSTAYIPKEVLESLDIKVLSLSVSFGDEIYKETEITNQFFFEKLDQSEFFPKSSQPTLAEVEETFENILIAGHDLVGVFLSSDMSGTFQSACMIASDLRDKYPDRRIEMIDSRSNCMQLGLAVLKGAEMVTETFDIVVEKVKHVTTHSRFVFIPDTMEYLKRGGRIGSAKALLSSVLQIKPILTVAEGKTAVIGKVRTRKKAIQAMINIFREDQEKGKITGGYVHHIHCADDAKKFSDQLGEAFDLTAIGPVIGTHVGPGAIGVAYCWE